MELKVGKKRVNISLYTDDFDCKTYYGRLLGLIDDQEFAAMIGDSKLQKKCITKETKPLSDIADNWSDLTGYRLVIALKKVNGIDVCKKLLITDRLGLVSFVRQGESESSLDIGISTAGSNGSYVFLQEEEECT